MYPPLLVFTQLFSKVARSQQNRCENNLTRNKSFTVIQSNAFWDHSLFGLGKICTIFFGQASARLAHNSPQTPKIDHENTSSLCRPLTFVRLDFLAVVRHIPFCSTLLKIFLPTPLSPNGLVTFIHATINHNTFSHRHLRT